MTRYIVGIDLGTTNCAMAFIDLKDKKPAIQVHAIHQLIKPGEVGKLPLLPSFLYLPGDHELPTKSCSLPWDDARNHLCGEAARYQGAKVPGRLVSSAKSWLCIVSTLRVMSQQEAPPALIATFIFSIVLIYVAISTLLDRKKVAQEKAAQNITTSEPDFPVPVIPNTRVEQING